MRYVEKISVPRLPLIVWVATLFAGIGDAARRIDIQGPLTVVVALFIAGLLGVELAPRLRRGHVGLPVPWGLVLFLGVATLGMLAAPDVVRGSQNLLLYAIFVGAIAAMAWRADSPRRCIQSLEAFRAAGVVAACLYLGGVFLYGPDTDSGLISARSAATTMVIPLICATVLRLYCRRSIWPLAVMLPAILLSLSRAQTAECLVILVIAFALGARTWVGTALRLAGATCVGIGGLIYAYFEVDAFRQRFVTGDGFAIGGFTIGSSGRNNLWSVTFDHWLQSPWLGHGAGASEVLIRETYPPVAHPHNDYLRLLHDFGVVGFLLWIAGMATLVTVILLRLRREADSKVKAIHVAALLGTLYLTMDMVLNNPVTVLPVMLPLGVLLGMSLGLLAASDPLSKRRAWDPHEEGSDRPSTSSSARGRWTMGSDRRGQAPTAGEKGVSQSSRVRGAESVKTRQPSGPLAEFAGWPE